MPDAPAPVPVDGPAAFAADPAVRPGPSPDAATRLTRGVALAAVLGLVALGLAWELWLSPTGRRTWALKVLPLLLALAGLYRYRLRTYRWLALAVWLYFAEGAVRATSEHGLGARLAGLQALLALLLFGACAWHVRWRLARSARPQEIER